MQNEIIKHENESVCGVVKVRSFGETWGCEIEVSEVHVAPAHVAPGRRPRAKKGALGM